MAKHFARGITDTSFTYARNEESIAEEADLDGLYVLRTNVQEEQLDTVGVVLAYKSLAHVEQAFRHFKLSDLEVYAPSTTTPNLGCGRICCCACWLTGYSGRCSRRWRRCSSWMRLRRRGLTQWPQRPAQRRRYGSTGPNAPRMGSRCIASGRFWRPWAPW